MMIRRLAVIFTVFSLFAAVCDAADQTMICTGEGRSRDEAVKDALIQAVSEAYGAFISSNTSILDDELVKDEVIRLNRGNVKKYEVISDIILPDKGHRATVSVVVSPEKLLKYARSKGSETELAGDAIAMNIRIYKQRQKNAVKVMEQLFESLSLLAPDMYDYRLTVEQPILDNGKIYLPVAVDCRINDTGVNFYQTYGRVVADISNSLREVPVEGSFGEKCQSLVSEYKDMILSLSKIWCYGFIVKDNRGNRTNPVIKMRKDVRKNPFGLCWPLEFIKPQDRDVFVNFSDRPDCLYANYISDRQKARSGIIRNFNYANILDLMIESIGFEIEKLKFTDNYSRSRALNGFTVEQCKAWCGVAGITDVESYLRCLLYGMLETPRNTWINTVDWFPYRLNGEIQVSKGESNGKIKFLIVYPEYKISDISGIKVIPLSQYAKSPI